MKRNRSFSIALTALFCGFLGLFLALFLLLPKSDFSEKEKRVLAKAPKLTLSSMLDGSFEQGFEDYLADHAPLRDILVGVNACYEQLSLRNGLGDVIREKDGALAATPETVNEDRVRGSCERINAFAEKTGLPVTVLLIPSVYAQAENSLPALRELCRDDEAAALARETLSDDIPFLYPEEELTRGMYYRTDHHLTSEGCFTAYNRFLRSLDRPVHSRDEYEIEQFEGFYGTAYAKSGLWLTDPDSVEIWQSKAQGDVTVEFDDRAPSDSLFFREHLSELDQYPVFLDGNHALVTIRTGVQGENLLLIRDSFGHCFAPFAADDFARITLVDLRYYRLPVSELAKETDIDRVLVLYGMDTFLTGNDLVFLK